MKASEVFKCSKTNNISADDLQNMKSVTFWDAELQPETLARFSKLFPMALISRVYTVPELGGQVAVPIPETTGHGFLAHNLQAKVCDNKGNSLETHRVGRLFFAVDHPTGVSMLGAQNSEESLEEDHWYGNGDQGYLTEDGELFVTQKNPSIVIAEGDEVNLTELEGYLKDINGVSEAAVIDIPDSEENVTIVVVVVRPKESELNNNTELTEDDVAKALSVRMRRPFKGFVTFVNTLQSVAKATTDEQSNGHSMGRNNENKRHQLRDLVANLLQIK